MNLSVNTYYFLSERLFVSGRQTLSSTSRHRSRKAKSVEVMHDYYYHRFVLSKLSWHFTIANLGKTWVVENIDNLVASYLRQWFELPISATLSTLILPKSKYGINCILPSTKFLQCQTVIRNSLRFSPNSDINSLWAQTSIGCNIQYDQYKNTKQVLTVIQKDNENRITHELKSQGFKISCILTRASSKTRSLWSTVQQSMPKNIFNFSLKY